MAGVKQNLQHSRPPSTTSVVSLLLSVDSLSQRRAAAARVPSTPTCSAAVLIVQVVFLLVEFQLVSREAHRANSEGDSRHSLYKARQRTRAFRRLLCDEDEN